ncbi:monofunctional biosynthetic peptidoglycan transglycosylase [Sulfitobacter sp. D35]|uniref:monofunctional biosynthetic peptidoglycan transglycosylase n=1 Tax=Sulfitobacter sp. D35 TaxID=3083252 RepID=UPI00296F0B82|nr:monofunctional biosynthetic peptidoglycan transglycosylase [Sulfitobacter sp. D35]MDW4498187.1 monofunctional biosynthetic peptidoglycan transglycosylase [Sulfitobacter sp. D35]
MARRSRAKKKEAAPLQAIRDVPRRVLRWAFRLILIAAAVLAGLIVLFSVVNPPVTPYMLSESRRLGGLERTWAPIEDIAPVMARSVVAAEDANFCTHWGFDLKAIKAAIADGGERGASTLSQQVVKNVYLWHGRTYTRKLLEALLTPVVELVWSKRRIVEVYMNVAEFDEGIFGVDAAARHYFGVSAADLSATQAARLAAILPDPKGRSASRPSDFVQRRARGIADGAATIRADGRAACFES